MSWLRELEDVEGVEHVEDVEQFVDNLAFEQGYEKVNVRPNDQGRMSSYIRRGTVKIIVYLTTGTVATCLDHPRRGKTQLFRRNLSLHQIQEVFDNPRTHTGTGYLRRNQARRFGIE